MSEKEKFHGQGHRGRPSKEAVKALNDKIPPLERRKFILSETLCICTDCHAMVYVSHPHNWDKILIERELNSVYPSIEGKCTHPIHESVELTPIPQIIELFTEPPAYTPRRK